jgi:hypothetical protein
MGGDNNRHFFSGSGGPVAGQALPGHSIIFLGLSPLDLLRPVPYRRLLRRRFSGNGTVVTPHVSALPYSKRLLGARGRPTKTIYPFGGVDYSIMRLVLGQVPHPNHTPEKKIDKQHFRAIVTFLV